MHSEKIRQWVQQTKLQPRILQHWRDNVNEITYPMFTITKHQFRLFSLPAWTHVSVVYLCVPVGFFYTN